VITRKGHHMERHGAGNAAPDNIPEVLMCVAVKSVFAPKKVMADELSGTDDGSWWA